MKQLARTQLHRQNTSHLLLSHQQIQYKKLIKALDIRIFQRGLKQGMQNMKTGFIGGKPGTFGFHATKTPHLHSAIRFAAPGATPTFQLHQLLIGMADKIIHHILIGQPVAARDCILKMLIQTIFRQGDRCGAAFCGHRMRSHRIHLGQ